MAALVDFARYVRTEVPMCPDIQILDAILHAGIDFCKRTKIMQQAVTLNTVINTSKYDLVALIAAGSEPDDILNIKRDGSSNLEISSQYDALKSEQDSVTGTPQFFYLSGNDLHLIATPDSVEALTVTVKARPTVLATTLPDELYRRYNTKIAAGAKAMLMMQANQPWSNLEGAAINQIIFDKAVANENLRYSSGGGSKKLRSASYSF